MKRHEIRLNDTVYVSSIYNLKQNSEEMIYLLYYFRRNVICAQ